MSDLEDLEAKVAAWLQPLPDAAAPCGPDLEYDNDFLALTLAASGKPDSQFGPAEPPDWPAARAGAEELLGRSRDLRIAITWLRAGLHTNGVIALSPGLGLLCGLIETHWDHVHPMPDPDDGDPYARVNALTILRENNGLLGDLREAFLVNERTIGQLKVQTVEAALGASATQAKETPVSKDQVVQMVAARVAKDPELRTTAKLAAQRVRQLVTLSKERLTSMVAPDLQPLVKLIDVIASVMPPEPVAADEAAEGEAGAASAGGAVATPRGLSGSVNSREEAIRAIDMVCEYMERAEPANPAPLFLRRARHLIHHNFLQLMKVLAPDALAAVAKVVGVDPAGVKEPDAS
jgi:type VI secretion system protein ImpA